MPIAKQVAEAMTRASWIRRMFEEGAELKAKLGPDRVFDMSLGNPIAEPPEAVRAELRRLVNDPVPGMHRYMSNQGLAEAREAIAARHARAGGVDVGADGVVLSCGAAACLNVLFHALLDPGSEVVIVAPFFPEYLFYAANHGGVVKIAKTTDDFLLDVDAIEREVGEATRAVVICSPNNPTGRLYDEASLKALADMLARKAPDALLVSDEPYRRIIFDGHRVPNLLDVTTQSVIISSHSKDIGLAGERLGFVLVHPEARDRQALLDAMVFSNRTLGFVNAPALMQRVIATTQHATVDVADYQRKRDLLHGPLVEAGYACPKPEGAFYLFPRAPIDDDVAFVRKLIEHGVLVVPGSGFGWPGHFRISYCVEDRVLEGALAGFRAAAEQVRAAT